MRRGFTLVELSIVLVIIGLLIGGILVGQSMIATTKVLRITSDIQKYTIGITNFKLNYKSYPGDDLYFNPPGNNDGALGNSPSCYGNYILNENSQVWAHMSQARMLDKQYFAYSPLSCGGPHNDDVYDSSLAGVVWPYIEISQKAVDAIGIGSIKFPVMITKAQAGNAAIYFYVNPSDSLGIEAKLGRQEYDGSDKQVGLVSFIGVGKCLDAIWSEVSCYNADAVYSIFTYYIEQ